MAEIPKDLGKGGRCLTGSGAKGDAALLTILNEMYDDLAALRGGIVAITAKLDAENVTNLDTDYAATCDPAALKTSKES